MVIMKELTTGTPQEPSPSLASLLKETSGLWTLPPAYSASVGCTAQGLALPWPLIEGILACRLAGWVSEPLCRFVPQVGCSYLCYSSLFLSAQCMFGEGRSGVGLLAGIKAFSGNIVSGKWGFPVQAAVSGVREAAGLGWPRVPDSLLPLNFILKQTPAGMS